MKTQITYIASSGNRYNLTANGVLHRTANYYNWTWDVVGTNLQYGVRVSDFSRKPAEYDAEIIIYGTPAERRRFLTMFHYDIENDIRKRSRDGSCGVITTSIAISGSHRRTPPRRGSISVMRYISMRLIRSGYRKRKSRFRH